MTETWKYEICLDEVGRGPSFGPTTIAGVILPSIPLSCINMVKDSKKFSNKKKLKEVAETIKKEVFAYHIQSIDAKTIDEINILQAVFRGMHECIRHLMDIIKSTDPEVDLVKDVFISVDGDKFKPFIYWDERISQLIEIPYRCIIQGDATHKGISCASIIAKDYRDDWIIELCRVHPELDERYGLSKNMGYCTKIHIDGIKKYGITQWHRRTFGICKTIQ